MVDKIYENVKSRNAANVGPVMCCLLQIYICSYIHIYI